MLRHLSENNERGSLINKIFVQAFLLAMLLVHTSHAVQNVAINEYEILNIDISDSEQNRIVVDGDRIKKIIVDSQMLEILMDKIHGQVFVMPIAPIKKVNATVFSESGIVQDVSMRVKKGLSNQTIFLKTIPKEYREKIISKDTALNSQYQSIFTRLQDFKINIPNSPINMESNQGIVLKKMGCVEEQGLIGKIYSLVNNNKFLVMIDERMTIEKSNLVSLLVEKAHLKSGDATFLYVIEAK